jgi:hypothetical protein
VAAYPKQRRLVSYIIPVRRRLAYVAGKNGAFQAHSTFLSLAEKVLQALHQRRH